MKDLKKLTKEAAKQCSGYTCEVPQVEIEMFIEGAEWERQRDKWISISNCKPEPNQNVLLYSDGVLLEIHKYWPAGFNGNSMDMFVSIKSRNVFDLSEVTHWQPLPESPESNY